MTENDYPGVLARVKAVIVDGIVLLMFMAIASSVFSEIENVPEYARIVMFMLIFLLYDPILTSTLGGTVGHQIIGLRVRKASDERTNINIILAVIRFVLKSFLGWISLFTVMGNKKRRAIHDFVSQSVVKYK